MKIAITGDLHLPITSKTQILEMTSQIPQNTDLIALLGDLGENLQSQHAFSDCLKLIKNEFKNIPVLTLCGNHDLWVNNQTIHPNSLKLFNSILPNITKQSNCIWLETQNFILNETAFVGSYLHYDYSAKDERIDQYTNTDYQQLKHKINNDGNYLHLGMNDIHFAKLIGDKFKTRLQTAQNDPTIKNIIVLSHVPCMNAQIIRKDDFGWAFGNAYFGNLSHEDLIKQCDKIRAVVSGHTHTPVKTKINAMDVIVLSSDYRKPTFELIEV